MDCVTTGNLLSGQQDVSGRDRGAAKAVLAKAREAAPDEIEVKFGIKVSGNTNWLTAKAAAEGNFEITLTWKPGGADTD